jgi:hypothetical protein
MLAAALGIAEPDEDRSGRDIAVGARLQLDRAAAGGDALVCRPTQFAIAQFGVGKFDCVHG